MVELVVRRPSGKRRRRPGGRKLFQRQKICRFCADSEMLIDYKDAKILRIFVTERHKIIPRRISGNCARHQRALTSAIKRARQLALMAFTTQHS